MPLSDSNFSQALLFRNGHIATIYSALLRKVEGVEQVRERIRLKDGDFLDLDWTFTQGNSDRLLVAIHGLEGDSKRPYMLGTAKIFRNHGFDVCCVNLRGCSGEANLKFRSYHSGATEDLQEVLEHIVSSRQYARIALKGFSLGGNLVLKYLGEGQNIPSQVYAGIGVSVPCNLKDSLTQLQRPENFLYAQRFLKHLKAKLREKQQQFPEQLSEKDVRSVKTLKDFDDCYTSRAHGFQDAEDYYAKASCDQFLGNISLPALILNAKNDSFLGAACYPESVCAKHPLVELETPDFGGHVGFVKSGGFYYNEIRSIKFLNALE